MTRSQFDHIRTWVFDLDNTLYPPAMCLFDQIEERMTDVVMRISGADRAQADVLRKDYWAQYGTTLAGLMHNHQIDPEAYLEEVHDVSFDVLDPDPHLLKLISQLPGRRIVYTNGSAPYAAKVLKARGLEMAFDAVYGVEHADYAPKPDAVAFEKVFARDGLAPETAAMFEDDARNLAAPYKMGLRTVHVAPDRHEADHIDHHTDDLNVFLARLT